MSDLLHQLDGNLSGVDLRRRAAAEIRRLTAEVEQLRNGLQEYWRAMDFYADDSDPWIEAHQAAKNLAWGDSADDKQEALENE